MSAAQLERLKEIFHSAQQLRPNQRSAFLDQTCGDDSELRAEIDALLKSDQAADGFMVEPPAQLAAEIFGEAEIPAAIGKTIGRYKLVERIGSGGMGEVYLAERADEQFKMQVAIKLIKRGMDTESVLRRFQHERQILASLEHPNIARLLDGGETEDGLPYFVMEHVKGERIDRYAEAKNLSLHQRLELFRQVCAAVSYAHQHLVVHRDLKPSNIVVTPEGVPKLLDFGIAKIIQADDGAEAFATITLMPVLTPEYASPEQFDGAPATTLSDVYSLGAVLYELLSGQTPYRLQTRSPQDIARVVTKEELPRPSTVVGQQRSEIRNRKSLRGDLDNIVLMAMRKETARRYRSVEQFSEDIRRHLTGLPVIAQPDTLSYRSAKFLRRNRLAVSAAALLFLTLLGGIVATTWQARRATIQEHRARAEQARAVRRFNEVRKLANSVLFDYHDAIKNLPGATKVRERLVKDALNYLDSLAGEANGDSALQRELAAAYERVGDVRGGEVSGSFLDLAGAMESYTKSLRIREALADTNRSDVQARRELASSHQKIGRLQHRADATSGVDHLQEALTLYLDLTREQPANDDLQLELARVRNQLGNLLSNRGDFAGALEQHRAAFAFCEKLAANNPSDLKYLRELWTSQDKIGYALQLQNDIPSALEANRKTLALGEALIAADPINADYQRCLMLSYQHGGMYRRVTTDKRGALELFRKAASLAEQMLAADPANALTCKDLGQAHKRIADLLVDLEDYPQALPHFQRALETYQKVVADAPADLISQFLVPACRAGVARMQAQLGEVDLALEECRQAKAYLQEITADKTPLIGRAQACTYLGYAYLALAESSKASAMEKSERTSAARDMFGQSVNVLDDLRTRQGTLGANEGWASEIAAQIAKCDTVLGK